MPLLQIEILSKTLPRLVAPFNKFVAIAVGVCLVLEVAGKFFNILFVILSGPGVLFVASCLMILLVVTWLIYLSGFDESHGDW